MTLKVPFFRNCNLRNLFYARHLWNPKREKCCCYRPLTEMLSKTDFWKVSLGWQEKRLSSILRQFNEEKITLEKVLLRQRWYKNKESLWKLVRAITEGVYWCGSKIELNRIILSYGWNLCQFVGGLSCSQGKRKFFVLLIDICEEKK